MRSSGENLGEGGGLRHGNGSGRDPFSRGPWQGHWVKWALQFLGPSAWLADVTCCHTANVEQGVG